MKFTKENIERILDDVEETPGALTIPIHESKGNREFDRGWKAAVNEVRRVLNDPERLAILEVLND